MATGCHFFTNIWIFLWIVLYPTTKDGNCRPKKLDDIDDDDDDYDDILQR